ncbi:hypothetical protein [Methylocella sp.]|uniref:hypothetical protein n=1 Tax=Methylocella sp. TaxID=1978226 RepID=UPI00378416D0
MADKDQQRLDRHLDSFQDRLPNRFSGWLTWLRQPSSRWVRLPAGVLLIVGSGLSVLPVFGLWMAPLGVVLLALDVPALQRPTGRALVRARLLWSKWRKRGANGGGTAG